MKTNLFRCLPVLTLTLALAGTAQASLLVYEGFNYTPGLALSGLSGGTGFDGASSWATLNSGAGTVSIKPDGILSGVVMSGTTINPYLNTYQYLADSGNYVGPSDGVANGSTAPDHMSMRRTLNSSVTATFTPGSRTYFSFTSARAFNANARAPSISIGAGYVTTASGDRGDTMAAGPNGLGGIALGGITAGAGAAAGNYPGATLNGVAANIGMAGMYLPQSYDTSGVRTRGSAVGGGAISSTAGTGPQLGDHAYWMQGGGGASSLLYGYSSVNTPVSGYGDNASKINIIAGEIEWGAGAGGTDLLSYYVFHDNDPLTEAAFDAGKATWDTLTVSVDRANWNQIGIAGGRYFADEVRIATTFDEALGVTPVPEPAALSLLALGGAALLMLRRRNKA